MKFKFLALLVLVNFMVFGQSQNHLSEQLIRTTIRIEATNNDSISTGTGFFFSFSDENDSLNIVSVIITNKHVIKDSKYINLFFRLKNEKGTLNTSTFKVTLENTKQNVIYHSDENIDLVAIPTNGIYTYLAKRSILIDRIEISEREIPDQKTQVADIKAIEDVYMIGYPNGLWDDINNLPIVRQGISASAPYLDYRGKKEFLIDIAAFKGSSGSPVFYIKDGIYTDKGTYRARLGVKFYFLGVLYAGPQYTVEGKVLKVFPIDSGSKVATSIPMNLGYVIKASEISIFKNLLFSNVGAK